jgi:hypothetical protein
MPGFITTTGTCNSSCASGPLGRVQLDGAAAYRPEARIMHELGHIATYKSQAYTYVGLGAYCWDFSSAVECGWAHEEAEWGVAAFEEAMATFAGSSALYPPSIGSPTSCPPTTASCSTTAWNLETSSGSSCASFENR